MVEAKNVVPVDTSDSVAVDTSGNVYISGSTLRAGANRISYDAWVAKYNSNGNLLWRQQLGTAEAEDSVGVAVDTLNNVYITGFTDGALGGAYQGNRDAWVAKYNQSSKLLWKKQLGSSGSDYSFDVAVDKYSNVYITGKTTGAITGDYRGGSDAWVAKYSPDGKIVWKQQLGTSSFEYSQGVAVDTFGNLYISGYTNGALGGANQGLFDAWVAKYPQTPPEQLNLRINSPSSP